MYDTSLASVTAEVEDLLVEKFSAKGRDLQQKIHSAGRRLPRAIRGDAGYLAEVQARCQNPKHAHQYDPSRVLKAQKHCVSQLEKIDLKALKTRRRLGWFTGLLVNFFILAIAAGGLAAYLGTTGG